MNPFETTIENSKRLLEIYKDFHNVWQFNNAANSAYDFIQYIRYNNVA